MFATYTIISLMLNFVFIILIILEIILTYFLFQKISILKKQVASINAQLSKEGEECVKIFREVKDGLKSLNKVFAYRNNEKVITAKKVTKVAIFLIQLFLLCKSLEFSKDKSVRLRNVKKILLSGAAREMLKKLLNHGVTRSFSL